MSQPASKFYEKREKNEQHEYKTSKTKQRPKAVVPVGALLDRHLWDIEAWHYHVRDSLGILFRAVAELEKQHPQLNIGAVVQGWTTTRNQWCNTTGPGDDPPPAPGCG